MEIDLNYDTDVIQLCECSFSIMIVDSRFNYQQKEIRKGLDQYTPY